MKSIFLDMDGCIVNFQKGYEDRVNEREPGFLEKIGYAGDFKSIEDNIERYYVSIAPNEKERSKAKYRAGAKFWSFVSGDMQWWLNLEWLPGGIMLVETLSGLRKNDVIKEFNILSSPGKSDPVVEPGKRKWLDKQSVSNRFDRIIIDREKYKYVRNHDDILIDDTPKKIDEWIHAGGTGILHKNVDETLSSINKILLNK
jgi:hypothetical protein